MEPKLSIAVASWYALNSKLQSKVIPAACYKDQKILS
jgi:hypothetical protein